MNEIVEDMLGRKFQIEQDERDNEVWRSQEYPEFTFKSIEKYKDKDGNCLLYAGKFGYSTIEYDEANDIIKGKEPDVTEYPTELVDIMPVTNQMFVPLVNNQVILNSQRGDYAAVCNAIPAHGIKIMFGIHSYCWAGIAPGTLNSPAGTSYGDTSDCKNILYRNIKRRLSTIDSPLEQIKTVASMLNANQELRNAIPYPQFEEIMTDFVENAQLVLKDNPEYAQKIFESFDSIEQDEIAKREDELGFYAILAENAPKVFIDNAKLIPGYPLLYWLPKIVTKHKELALQAFDAMPTFDRLGVESSIITKSWATRGIRTIIRAEEKGPKALRTFLYLQPSDENKEKMLISLLNNKMYRYTFEDPYYGLKGPLSDYIDKHSHFSDEFCESFAEYAFTLLKEKRKLPVNSIIKIIQDKKSLPYSFCKVLGVYARCDVYYTGAYLQALGKLPVGVDKTENYKDLVFIVKEAGAYSRLSEDDKQSAINYIVQSPEKLSPKFCQYMIETAKDMSDWKKDTFQPILKRMLADDPSSFYRHRDVFNASVFVQQMALQDHSLIPNVSEIDRENFDAFAKIYEEYASRDNNYKNLVGQTNVALDDGKTAQEIMDIIKDKILDNGIFGKGEEYEQISTPVQAWLVKNVKKYPNLVGEILKEKELPYVEMCIKNIENPEKENIASLLNRLEAKEAKSFEDFQEGQEFVALRDMCMRGCLSFVKEKVQELRTQDPDYTFILDSKQLSYEMAEAGIGDFKTAKRVAQLFCTLNERPGTYNSSYNTYYPKDLLPIAKSEVMQDWMYPVMAEAIKKGSLTMSEGRMPSERTLFDCCKAWKICPEMPQRLAKQIGKHSLHGRMLAGAIFEKMTAEGNVSQAEWKDNKHLHVKFYEELSRAEKMDKSKALRQYIPNIPVNRKRIVGAAMEDKGIENTADNFRELYRTMREKGVFEKVLAKPGEDKTSFSSRLLVETARRKKAKAT